MNGLPLTWVFVILIGLALILLAMRRAQTRRLMAARHRLAGAARAGYLRSVIVSENCRPITITVGLPADAGWLLQPAGIAAVQSVVPGMTVTADPSRVALEVAL
jgi:hypothetical protein